MSAMEKRNVLIIYSNKTDIMAMRPKTHKISNMQQDLINKIMLDLIRLEEMQ